MVVSLRFANILHQPHAINKDDDIHIDYIIESATYGFLFTSFATSE